MNKSFKNFFNQWIEPILLILVILAIGNIYFGKGDHAMSPNESGTIPRMPSSQKYLNQDDPDFLVKTQAQGIYEELNEDNKLKVRRAVQYFCSHTWETDSCLHHMITCGKKCMSYITHKDRIRVNTAYYQRRAQLNKGTGK